ncbi:MAG: phosphopyruvate hydratase [Rhizobiales bacterium TMED168]|nr:MAG: phosphopyruvate hydratase [Rhizobiales bacterium TMED168]|tara:strand:+ start:52876 stop:54147 length:1272 start_codon:yes stop_codon:yes gene_type:complete
MANIQKIIGRQIFDSRGNPTVEVDVILENGVLGRAAVPSGASTGAYEAHELRDNSSDYFGRGVTTAISNINNEINKNLSGLSSENQKAIDNLLINLDGTENKSRLGANAILGVSLATAKASAKNNKIQLFEYLSNNSSYTLPVPMMNIINGGAHANNLLDFQEFMIMPISASSFQNAMQMGSEIFHSLKKILSDMGEPTSVGDEGGFAPNIASPEDTLSLLCKAVENSGYKVKDDIVFALDVAATEFQKDGFYNLTNMNNPINSDEMINYLKTLIDKFPIFSIEDPLGEDDWEAWTKLNFEIGDNVQIVGDDLFVTNSKRLKKGIELNSANSILIKVNQIGTLTETFNSIEIAENNNYSFIISHRSGETEDNFIADLSVATESCQIKTGSLTRSDRVSKYNQLIRIEEFLGKNSKYAGKSILK